jgi:transposase-like protein
MTTEDKQNEIKQIMDEITSMGYKELMLSESQVAGIIGVSASTLANWRRKGIGVEYKKLNNGKRARVMYPKKSVADWVLTGNIKVA